MASTIMHPVLPSDVNHALPQETSSPSGSVNGVVEQETTTPISHYEAKETSSTSSDQINLVDELSSPVTSAESGSNGKMNGTAPTSPTQVDELNDLSSPVMSAKSGLNGKMNGTVSTSPTQIDELNDLSSPAMSPLGSPIGNLIQNSSHALSPASLDVATPPSLPSPIANGSTTQADVSVQAIKRRTPSPSCQSNMNGVQEQAVPSPSTRSNISKRRASPNPPSKINDAKLKPSSPKSKVLGGRVTKTQKAKIALAEKRMALWNNAEELIGKANSPLYDDKTDIMAIIRLAQVENALPADLSSQIAELTTDQLKRAVIDFKNDGAYQRNSSKWRIEAQMASHDRATGKYDPVLIHRLEEKWGVKMEDMET